MRSKEVEKHFGKSARVVYEGGQHAIRSLTGKTFEFMGQDEYFQLQKDDPIDSQRIYWEEMLFRAYVVSAVSLQRNDAWLHAVISSVNANQVLLFAASLRGLIESVGDSSYSTRCVSGALTEGHEDICSWLLRDEPKTIVLSAELEDMLIHFTHGRRILKAQRDDFPESHAALFIQQYLDVLVDDKVPLVKECYDTLCDFTHPGMSSTLNWIEPTEDGWKTTKNNDKKIISSILKTYEDMFEMLFFAAYNPPLWNLTILNHFPLSKVHTKKLNKMTWRGSKHWENVIRDLRRSRFYRNETYAA